MDVPPPPLDRIGQLPRDGNGLRRRDVLLQGSFPSLHPSPIHGRRAGLARALPFFRSYG